MGYLKTAVVGVLSGALALTSLPANAGVITSNAEAVRKLDIMLMVTSLRCRTTSDNFQADYRRFSAAHLSDLNLASRTLQARLVHSHGQKGAKRALDKISVGMANEYGQGHPWLNCGQLKQAAKALARDNDSNHLASAANELLARAPRGQWAMAN
ncbi:S-adenosyl-L-homocysteine hydrolase [Porphyrobacter algicida]|uniref:S-adenosyl-L-homocysteine hydrolase n=1 Tax=Qipengyuania algicida TaxID=1836209 RepID=A0A845AIF8_9SPHN|nr:S-adenosyl-L-homocysteine hydrolase [Qipengyuania algicida]MXP29229.1 S-adenosyl-L-homocysteine hydrolase [Qipengyuania algicida]